MTSEHQGGRLPNPRKAIRYHWGLVAVSIVLATGAGAIFATSANQTYESEVTLLLKPANGNPLSPDAASRSSTQLTIAMETERGIAATPRIASRADELTGGVMDIDDDVTVTVPGGTQLMRLRYTADSAEGAMTGATAYGDAFLEYRKERAEQNQEAQLEPLREMGEIADEDLRRAVADTAQDDALTSYAAQEVQLFLDRLIQINSEISAAEALSTDPGQVVNPAEKAQTTSALTFPLTILLGALLGALVGVILALVREWRHGLVRDSGATHLAGLPVLSAIPAVRGHSLLTATETDPLHEVYRRMRTGIVVNNPRPMVIAVAAVDDHSSASAIGANLATVLTEAGYSVVLVSANPMTGFAESHFGAPTQPGVAEVVAESAALKTVIHQAFGLSVVSMGSIGDVAGDPYSSPKFGELIAQLRSSFDYVVVDSAPVGTSTGEAVLSMSDGVLLAVSPNITTQSGVAQTLQRFERLRVCAIGAVLAPAALLTAPSVSDQEASAKGPESPQMSDQGHAKTND